ncbi:MAG TPA: ATP-binding protein [Methanosarcinales archaeon]|nr:ATP-binding protein [Methanosarcinales archaeon]
MRIKSEIRNPKSTIGRGIVMTVIGMVKTHGKQDFTFITKKLLRTGEFVSYYDKNSDKEILCRVINTEPLKDYPTDFLLDIEVDAKDVSEFYGLDIEEFNYYMVYATVIGYYDDQIKEFINPRTKPSSGTKISSANKDILNYINKVNKGAIGSAYIGKILGTDFDIVLSVKDIVSQHLSIIAATGAGKSYTVGVLIEELLQKYNRASVLIFDPHGEYVTLDEINNDDRFCTLEYRPKVKIVKPENIKIKISELSISDFLSLINDGTMSQKMISFFSKAYNNLKNDNNRVFTRNELKKEILSMSDGSNESTIQGILWRYNNIIYNSIFHDHEGIPIVDYFQKGQLTVVDISGIEETFQQLIAAVLLRKLFDIRVKTDNGIYTIDNPDKYLPYPVFVILEEAHRFTPQNGVSKSKNILKTILSEGRKFGVGVCLVTQRPSKLDADSLSQCMTQITLRIINPTDQKQIAQSIESVSRDLIEELPALAKGQAIISGVGINTPTTVKIRTRYTRHERGASKNAPLIWTREDKEEKEVLNIQHLKIIDEELNIGI